MKIKVVLFVGSVLALVFLVLSLVALDMVPKYVDDTFCVWGIEGKLSEMVSVLCYGIAAFCSIFVWMVYRALKMKRNE